MHRKNIPNAITIFRIVLALVAVIFYFLAVNNHHYLYTVNFTALNLISSVSQWGFIGACLFFIAAISDFFDGYLARKWKVVSNFGKIVDPIADKVLINGTFLILAINFQIAVAWAVLLFIVRDIMLDSLRMISIRKKIIVSARNLGKWKTFLQIIAILWISLLFSIPITQFQNSNFWFYFIVQNGFTIIALFFSLASFIDYSIVFIKNKVHLGA
ncbi:CDP-diacylglycerol--glycerol-3-phosphate 3-phosphatidyltransferase [Mycoplasmoides fastidiosum]|uniref:CDP-diacylglycerol--glycerol-3-phosphate 3-phosphatidyltransferase n=1 Tax=Mycoplasmoides fastidiosum TaxID=92758 RepID=UPI002113E56A|nr:CDP-diacylglycerol--glycerol-3-phosphate 3-phosphatidyltransferase [Mycoplasmoides fastidiosum]UUD37822.1 CDP-diacylglycerol--glycerol-3-phosphate 3-phosphatidyltransferase [Mycoplasmoides fastidiosum]